ncbi:MAG: glycerophosphodiester phosphodiesterase family protein [Pseudomonadota bacterium]
MHKPTAFRQTSRRMALKARFRARPRKPMVSVHRGLWPAFPENSLSAILAARSWDVVEIDVQLDRHGTPYLMHDDTLTRMTGDAHATGVIGPDHRAKLRLKAGAGGAAEPFTDEPVPTLEQAFNVLEGSSAAFDLDVKHAEQIDAVGAAVADMGHQNMATLKMDVASAEDIAALVALEKRYDIMVMAKLRLQSRDDLALVVALREADVAAVEIWFDDLNLLRRATSFAGDLIRFGTYTLDDVHCCGLSDSIAVKDPGAVWGRLLGAGIGLIMTDRPEALSRYLMTR